MYIKQNRIDTPVKKQRSVVEADDSSNETNQLAVGNTSLRNRDRGRRRENECERMREGAYLFVVEDEAQ